MDGNGMTGLNPVFAKNNIMEFDALANEALASLTNSFIYLFDELHNVWCSPKAKEFSDKYNVLCGDLCVDLFQNIENICFSAQNAYNIVARGQGVETISGWGDEPFNSSSFGGGDVPQMVKRGEASFTQLEEQHSLGVVGMNVQAVRLVLDQFSEKIKGAMERLTNLPTAVALFDDENAQQYAFEQVIEKMEETADSLTNQMYTDIKAAIETESDSVVMAAKKATETLQSENI